MKFKNLQPMKFATKYCLFFIALAVCTAVSYFIFISYRDKCIKEELGKKRIFLRELISGNIEEIKKLYSKYNIDIKRIEYLGGSAIFIPLSGYKNSTEKTWEVMNFLISKGANIHDRNSNGTTILMHAIYMQTPLELIENLLKAGVEPGLKDDSGDTALHCSSRNQDIRYASLILKYGADINAGDKNNRTTLYQALNNGNYKLAEFLIGKGADVNISSYESPLSLAVYNNQAELVKLILEHKGNPNIRNSSNQTPLNIAAARGSYEIVDLLLNYKADPDIGDDKKITPLFYAVIDCDYKMAQILMEHKADPDIKNNYGESPLSLAGKRLNDPQFDRKEYEKILNVLKTNRYGIQAELKTYNE
ncbi:MAG: hypothetical protein A2017_00395 [Lentisphaerae bacterium GWF2_44_16]|nr:MAG: hypothetical protein A2017_00395 [Lentisphaerae bacterium GWF2_44_16]